MSDVDSGYQLSVLKGEDRGRVIPLTSREIHLGRKSSGVQQPHWLCFAEPTVSRHHATLVWDENQHHYTIYHKSRTNPTLVNGKRIQHCPLTHEDVVQVGLLIFRLEYIGAEDPGRDLSRFPQSGLQAAWTADEDVEPDTPVELESGLRLVVLDGPDEGTVFGLNQPVLFVGRRESLHDVREANGILLNDRSLPGEQVLLAWNEREQTYGIFQVESSPVPTHIQRYEGGETHSIQLTQSMQLLLQLHDVIEFGETALRLEMVNAQLDDYVPAAPARGASGREADFESTEPVVRRGPPMERHVEPDDDLPLPTRGRRGLLGGRTAPKRDTGDEESSGAAQWPPDDEPTVPRPVAPSSPEVLRPRSGGGSLVGSTRRPSLARAPQPERPVQETRAPRNAARPSDTDPTPPTPERVRATRSEKPATPSSARGQGRRGEADQSMRRTVSTEDETPYGEAIRPRSGLFSLEIDESTEEERTDEEHAVEAEHLPQPASSVAPIRFPSLDVNFVRSLPTRGPEAPRAEKAAQPPPASSTPPPPPAPAPSQARSSGAAAPKRPSQAPPTPSEPPARTPRTSRSDAPTGRAPAPRAESERAPGLPSNYRPPELLEADSDDVESLDFKDANFAWRYRADFILGFLDGPNRGQKVELLTRELTEGRRITMGSPGERLNDIEIDDAEVANEQATITYAGGRFSLLNEGGDGQIYLNQIAIGEGEEVLLKTGDRLSLGESVLNFLERSVVAALSRYELVVTAGEGEDQGQSFDLLREVVVLGRNRSCDIALTDPDVSRKHLAITLRSGRFYLTHISTTSPTFVNGISLPRGRDRLLNEGDKIQVSDHTTLLFCARSKNG